MLRAGCFSVRFCFVGFCIVVGSTGAAVSMCTAWTNRATAWQMPLRGQCMGSGTHMNKIKRKENKQTD